MCRNLLAAFLLLVFAIYSAWLDEVLFYLHICLLFSSTPNVPVGKVKLKKRPKWKALYVRSAGGVCFGSR